MAHPSLIATLVDPPSSDGTDLTALPGSVEWLEVRADRVGDIDPDWLRSHFPGRLLYSFQSTDEDSRRKRLETAAKFYDRVELQTDSDLSAELLQQIPPEKRLLAWYGNVNDLTELENRFEQLSSRPAAVYKLVTKPNTIAEELLPLFDGPSGFVRAVLSRVVC